MASRSALGMPAQHTTTGCLASARAHMKAFEECSRVKPSRLKRSMTSCGLFAPLSQAANLPIPSGVLKVPFMAHVMYDTASGYTMTAVLKNGVVAAY